jgi:phosphoglycolate phosphatase
MDGYRLLVLDFDGTLAETSEDVAWCMKQTFESHGFKAPDPEAVLATIGLTLEDSFRRLRDEYFSLEELSTWVQTYRALYRAEGGRRSRLFPGVADALKAVNELGLGVVVVSNKGADAIQTALRKFEVNHLVTTTLGGDMTAHKKPHPALYHYEIKRHFGGIGDDEALVVGDTKVDLDFAKNAGLAACWASYGYGEPDECKQMEPEFVVREFREIPALARKGRALRTKAKNPG